MITTQRSTRLATRPLAAVAAIGAMLAAFAVTGCIQHNVKIEPIKIEPIYAKIDITIREKVEQDLSTVFDYGDEPGTTPQPKGGN